MAKAVISMPVFSFFFVLSDELSETGLSNAEEGRTEVEGRSCVKAGFFFP